MRSLLAAVLGAALAAACSTAQPPASAPVRGTPNAPPAANGNANGNGNAPAPLPNAQPSAPSGPAAADAPPAELVLSADGGRGRYADLEISVVNVTEKWTMEGSSMMRVTLRLVLPGGDETLQITSDEPIREWKGYVLEYRGGWRKEVQLLVRRRP